MAWYDETRSQQRNLCSAAFTYAQIIEQTIFARINDRTTPQQYEAGLQSLKELCQRLESQMDWSHYPASHGLHSCIRDVYTDAEFRLKNLAIMHQPPSPPARQQVVTVEGVVIEAEERLRTSSQETYLGTDDSTPDNGTAR
jgi:hypothetical protein